MEKSRIVTFTDYQRLFGLIETASLKTHIPDSVWPLYQALIVADMFPQESVPDSVITMNSRILLKDILSERSIELTLTYPRDANNKEGKISIFSAIGAELFGREVGDIVSWKVPAGDGRFEILEIIYQPEAVGDYSL